jgi:uncharacterized protein (DUF433 family)
VKAQRQEEHWRQYIEEYSRRTVPIIRDKGFSVWSLVGYYRVCAGDKQQVLADYRGYLTGEELDAALAYYKEFPDDIDRKLWELEH